MQLTFIDDPIPSGLLVLPDFISEEDEALYVGHLEGSEWSTALQRRTQHFGYRYNYSSRGSVTKTVPMPGWMDHIAKRIHDAGLSPDLPNAVLVNEYEPGQGIAPHVDATLFGPTIVSISLLDTWPMEFSTVQGEKLSVPMERRAAIVLAGEARTKWRHGIATRLTDEIAGVKKLRSRRVSLTFRSIS